MSAQSKEDMKGERQCYWMINQFDYSVNGIEVKRGQMARITPKERHINNPSWRLATKKEVKAKKFYEANYFCLIAWI